MTIVQITFLALVFISVFGMVAFFLGIISPSETRQRLLLVGSHPSDYNVLKKPRHAWFDRLTKVFTPLSDLSVPDEGWEKSGIRMRFLNAGIRNASAPLVYFSAKTVLALAFPLTAYMLLSMGSPTLPITTLMPILLLVATIGYYLPNAILSHMIALRQREIFESFPDALDLMTVCVEAGLGVDAALSRVAVDIEQRSEVLSEELRLVGLELRAGSDRERALRNLAARTGVAEVDGLVAMLVQADRFGTSIASTLRIHSQMLRTKRRQRAEEAAAKIALKLLFPLIFCIFPSLLLVLMGPAFVHIYRILLPSLQ
ncbi:type II secretion system F family protein [Uliginosibacterium flavum]|uniref:Type II secretion system F family protein n=1 Tax=Uliginosibacterium flavum TaxID=1396831 RepID=A0ABV2TIT3_9RHOO